MRVGAFQRSYQFFAPLKPCTRLWNRDTVSRLGSRTPSVSECKSTCVTLLCWTPSLAISCVFARPRVRVNAHLSDAPVDPGQRDGGEDVEPVVVRAEFRAEKNFPRIDAEAFERYTFCRGEKARDRAEMTRGQEGSIRQICLECKRTEWITQDTDSRATCAAQRCHT